VAVGGQWHHGVVRATASIPMVGRASELRVLGEVFAEAVSGATRIVVIGGEAGIGKSRLLEEFGATVPEALVLSGQCIDLGAVRVPYAPISGLLRDLVAAYGVDAVLDAAGNGRRTLLGLLEGTRSGAEKDDRSDVDRLNEVLTTLFEHFGAIRPLVIVIEDLHWADPATLDFLRFATRVLTRAPVLFALTFRSDDVGRRHPLRPFLAELERNRRVERITVNRLTRDEVREQVGLIRGSMPSADELTSTFDRSEGVPFFVEQLIGCDDGGVPATLHELLLGRYEALSDSAQHFLRTLAAGGARVDHSVLMEVCDWPESELEAYAREAIDANLIVVDGAGYAFRHALVRDAIDAELLPGESSRTHAAYAEALSARGIDSTERAGRAVAISFHWMEAHVLDRAFAASLEAMALSTAGFAFASAAQMGERALELWDRVADPSAGAAFDHVELLHRTAIAWRNAGEASRALATLDQALAEADLADGVLVAKLLRAKGVTLTAEGRGDSLDAFERALSHLPVGADPMLRAGTLADLAAQYMVSGHSDKAVALASEALDIAPPEARRSASVAANVRGGTYVHTGRIAEGLADFALAKELAGRDSAALLRYFVNASDVYQLLGQFERSLEIATEGLELARAAGVERSSGAILTVNTVDPLFALGRWQRADELIEASLELEPPAVFRSYLRRAELRSVLWRGDPERAWRLWERSRGPMMKLAEFENQTRAGNALDVSDVAFARGDLEGAWQFAGILLKPERVASPGWTLPLAPMVARLIARRRADGGADNADNADDEARLREVLAADSFWPTHPLWAAIVDAELSGLTGVGDDVDAWRVAVDATVAQDASVLTRLQVAYGLARAQVLSADRQGAAETLATLRGDAERVGAGLIVTWVDDLAEQAGLPGSRAAGARATHDSELTSREQQVLELIAEGLSNGQIAERLYISAKTVSVHVSAILRKVGAASRTEAVRLAAGQLSR
jgi:DNA-binding CsgD family transcriptional regulator/tetratricopeptide (TPR) repeat protein